MTHRFIVLEGIDGVGKSALATYLTRRFNEDEEPCIEFDRWPGKTSLFSADDKERIRQTSVLARFLAYTQSLMHKSSQVATLRTTHTIVMDRYVHSVMAHHLALGLPQDVAMGIHQALYCRPTHVFHVTVPEEIRLARVQSRKGSVPDDFESAADTSTLLGRKLHWFRQLVRCTVDTTDPAPEVGERLYQLIRSRDIIHA